MFHITGWEDKDFSHDKIKQVKSGDEKRLEELKKHDSKVNQKIEDIKKEGVLEDNLNARGDAEENHQKTNTLVDPAVYGGDNI